MSIQTSTRLRTAALLVTPVLAFSAACGGNGGYADGAKQNDGVASVPDAAGAATGGAASPESTAGEPAARGKGAFFDAQMKYVQCMRTEGGVKDFPDPKLSGHLDWAKIDAITSPSGSGEEQKGGKGGACGPEMSEAMKLEPKRDAQKDYESMLAHAKCMRENGISKFTNPTMSGGNVMPGGDPNPVSPQIDRNSPTLKAARETCKPKLLDGLDGMQG
ncbi:hypothetical protein [Streptomyces sp. NBC_01264]|uniref:hypothetical protein n=1 Tax=Streptomyces sp. NBC_01264 TaxID=2903804 RepID=UPI00225619D0|nr:hypothetical protein [Streptomyces sp. NBC_01264]MCX4775488.1 hypothetical protein [Streptomyces sp. NBC_01264]